MVEDFHYGAVAVAQRIEELAPRRLILVGAEPRGLLPGSVTRRRISGPPPGEAQQSIEQAVTGYVSVDIAVRVVSALGTLPARTVVFEVEPETTGPSDTLSRAGANALGEVVAQIELEARRTPVLLLADELEQRLVEGALEDSASLDTLRDLLAELRVVEEQGRWGRTFSLRDRLVGTIRGGQISEGMSQLDWSLWWALIEELNRLAQLEAASS